MYCTHTPEHGSPKHKRINKQFLCTSRRGQYTSPPAGPWEPSVSYQGLEVSDLLTPPMIQAISHCLPLFPAEKWDFFSQINQDLKLALQLHSRFLRKGREKEERSITSYLLCCTTGIITPLSLRAQGSFNQLRMLKTVQNKPKQKWHSIPNIKYRMKYKVRYKAWLRSQ